MHSEHRDDTVVDAPPPLTWRTLPPRERRFALLVAAVFIIATGLPYCYGWLRTPPGYTFTGIDATGPGDQHVYYSYIEQTRDGALAFRDLYTSEPHQPMVQLPWLAVGLLARVTGLSAPAAFHVSRLLLIVPFMAFLAVFIATFIRQPFAGISIRTLRRVAFLLVTFGMGAGTLLGGPALASLMDASENWPMDFWVAEAFPFLTAHRSPHLILSTIAMLATYLAVVRYDVTRRSRYLLHAMIAAGLLVAIHPFYLPSIPTILIAYAIARMIQERQFLHHLALAVVAIGAAMLPAFTYWSLLTALDPVHAARAGQNILRTGAWWSVVVSYGFLGVGGIVGLVLLARHRTTRESPARTFLCTWTTANALLLYAPFPWQRRFVQGFSVALALLTTFGLAAVVALVRRRIPQRWHATLLAPLTAWIIAVPLFGASTIVNVAREFVNYTIRFPTQSPREVFYYPTDGIEAMRWLHANAAPDAVTAATGETANFLPGIAVRPVFAGHNIETVNQRQKAEAFGTFLDPTTPIADRQVFLTKYHIDYLFDPHYDSRHPYLESAARALDLSVAYANPQVTIYRVPEGD